MAEEEIVQSPAESSETAPGAEHESAASAPALTADEISRLSYEATQKALADAEKLKAENEAAERERRTELQRRAAGNVNPQIDALDALDLRTDLYEEALALHPDLPQAARDQLKADIRSFKTIESLKAAKGAGLHIKLADAAAGSSMRSGSYVPEKVAKSVSVTREPVHTGPGTSSTKIPEEFRSAMEEVGREIGYKWSEAEMIAEYLRESAR